MTFVPDSKASVRLYSKHQRYARQRRLRYAAQKTAFLNAQVTRLEGASPAVTEQLIFDYLFSNSAFTIAAVTHYHSLSSYGTLEDIGGDQQDYG
jgi:hypothetical protein